MKEMDKTLNRLNALLVRHQWVARPAAAGVAPPRATAAFPLARALAARFASLESASGAIGFYGFEDFSDNSSEGWRFLEHELLRASAEDDDQDCKLDAFVSTYLPIALNVTGEYAFLMTDRHARIYESAAPDFEDLSLVASSLQEFVARLEADETAPQPSLLFRTWVADF